MAAWAVFLVAFIAYLTMLLMGHLQLAADVMLVTGLALILATHRPRRD